MINKQIFIGLLCISCIAIACDYSSSDEDNTEEIDSSKSPSVRTGCSRYLPVGTTNQECKIPKRRRKIAKNRATRSNRRPVSDIRRRIDYESNNPNNFTREANSPTATGPVAQACCLDLIINPHGTTERIVMSPHSSTYPEELFPVNPPSATVTSDSTSRLVDMLSHLCSISTFTSPAGIPNFASNCDHNSFRGTANEAPIPLRSEEDSQSIEAQFLSILQREFPTQATAPAQASTSRSPLIQADAQPSCSGSSVRTRTSCPIERTLAPETVSALDNIVQSMLSEIRYPGQWETPVQHATLSSIREVSTSYQMNDTDTSDSDEEHRNHYRFLLDQIRSNADSMLASENLSDRYNLIEAELETNLTDNPAVVYTEVLAGSHRQAQIIAREIRELAKQMLEEYKYSPQKLNKLISKIKKLKDLDSALRYSFNSLSVYVNNNIECVGSLYYVKITKPMFKKYVDDCKEIARILEYLKKFCSKHYFKF